MAKRLNATTAPDFTLKNMEGEAVTLSDYRGDKYIVLVFNRGFL